MNYLANKFYRGAGIGKGETRLVSFDEALINAGVGNYNLVRLSSILPIQAVENERDHVDLPYGTLLPIAYAEATTCIYGCTASAAVAIGVPKDRTKCCVIMEYEELDVSAEDVSTTVKMMVEDAFHKRGWELDHIMTECATAQCTRTGEYATAFACVAEWSD